MIKKALVFALVAAVCVGCRPSTSKVKFTERSHAEVTTSGDAAPARVGVALPRRLFASLPDRGDLVAYPVPTPARQDGAYTWHRAELSEAHAFRSLQTGSLRITSPSGQPLEFEYYRHVEHPSGDWTWVGRLKGGKPSDEAVITFGERAAFGSIAEPGKPALRLISLRGTAWMVETDPTIIATLDNEATRPTTPDYLLPPDPVAAVASMPDAPLSANSAPSYSNAASTAAATTVDVVVGYTSGYAAELGGQSQAVTRLNNLIETANQAYVNSQVNAAVRMVHALQVNYPDNTANKTALEELTGYRSGSGPIPVPAALQPLRDAREVHGGDLVTLVRRFNSPENEGCGIAWLIGGGRRGIDAGDAPYGYSVASDLNNKADLDEVDKKSYICREETLAHELGHNMGSQHDRVTATENGELKYGVFTYSFGHKTDATAGNFYTVMAYGDSGQFSYRVFSNPRTTFCGGLPCGVAEQADNARSLTQTMPVVATFRASAVPAARVVRSVVGVLKTGASGRTETHSLSASSGYQQFSAQIATALLQTGSDLTWRFQIADFNRDGVDDLYAIYKAGASGRTEVHVLNGATSFQTFLLHAASALGVTSGGDRWMFKVGNYDGDGIPDLFAIDRTGASGRTDVHVLTGASSYTQFAANIRTALGATGTDSSWDFAMGDLDRDGRSDLFAIAKLGQGSGRTEVHVLSGASIYQSFILHRATPLGTTGSDGAWTFKVGEADGDGYPDLYSIGRMGQSGRTEVHILSGSSSYTTFSGQFATALGATGTDGRWDFELSY